MTRYVLKDPGGAAAYLNAALEDGSQELFMLALRDVADAVGISDLSKKSGLNRENVYRIPIYEFCLTNKYYLMHDL